MIGLLAVARIAISLRPFTADRQGTANLVVLREYLDALIVAGLAALFLITFVVRTFFIPSGSMLPTLQLNDVLLVNEFAYKVHPPADGDIAVFTPPIDAGGNEFIKRVIGVPGDAISIRDGVVYRNGHPLREPYVNQPPAYNLKIAGYSIDVDNGDGVMRPLDPSAANIPPRALWQAPDRIPKGFYFMLGDNRRYSDDSHVWGFAQLQGPFVAGPLAAQHVASGFDGDAFLIFWPPNRLRVLH